MRQVQILSIPPTSDVAAFLEWVKQTLTDMAEASAENVFEPETLDVYATTTALTDAVAAEALLRENADTALAGDLTDAIAQEVSDRDDAIAAAIGAISNTITEFHGGIIAVPTNKAYTVILKIPVGCTIVETTTKSLSGTCTATFAIDGVALGGAAHSVSSTEESITRSSANAVAAGNDVTLTVSSNSSCLDLAFTIKTTRTIT